MAASESAIGVSLATGGAVAATFFQVPITTLGAGVLMCSIGVAGRAAFDVQRALKRGEPIKLQRILGWVGAGLLGSPMAAIIVMVVVKQFTNVEPDGMVAFGLLAFGFGGQDVVGPVWNTAKVYLNKLFGLNLDVDTPKEKPSDKP